MAIEIMFPSAPLPPPRRVPLWIDTRVSDAQRAALDFERITREAARRFQTARVPRREGSPEPARESLGVGAWRGTEYRIESREDRVVETDERGMLEVFTTTNGTRWQRAELSARDRERTNYPAPITPDEALEVAARYIERLGLGPSADSPVRLSPPNLERMYALQLTRDAAGPVAPRLAAWQVNHTLHVRNSDGAGTPMTGPGAKVQVNVNPAGVVIEHYAFVPEVGWHPEREHDIPGDGWDRFVGTLQEEIREDLHREGFPNGSRVRFGWASTYLTCPPRMRQNHIPLVVQVSGVLTVPPQKKDEGLFRQPIEYHFPLVPNRAGFKKAFAEVIDLLDPLPDASLPWDQDLDALFP